MTEKPSFWLRSIFSKLRLQKSLKFHWQQGDLMFSKSCFVKYPNLTPIVQKTTVLVASSTLVLSISWSHGLFNVTRIVHTDCSTSKFISLAVHSWGCLLNENPLTANFDRNGSYFGTSKEGSYSGVSLYLLNNFTPQIRCMDLRKSAHENIKLSVYLQI